MLGKKFLFLSLFSFCWRFCPPAGIDVFILLFFFPSFLHFWFSPARVCFYLQTLLEGKKSGTYCLLLLLLACGGKGEGLKVGHWPNGGSFPFDWLSYTPIHSTKKCTSWAPTLVKAPRVFVSYSFLSACADEKSYFHPFWFICTKWHSEKRNYIIGLMLPCNCDN